MFNQSFFFSPKKKKTTKQNNAEGEGIEELRIQWKLDLLHSYQLNYIHQYR